jgi:SAM-dependent methyltransferase
LEIRRLNIVSQYIEGDVLDLGCGSGQIFSKYNKKIKRYVGVDYDKTISSNNFRKYPNAIFLHKDLDVENLNLKYSFDVILMLALVEHIFNQKKLFIEAKKYLKPKGIILITTPSPFANDYIYSLGCKIGLFANSANDDHIVIYNKKRFTVLANEIELKLICFKYFEFGLNQFVIFKK